MKGVVIIAQPRTGGTNLMRSISSAYQKNSVFEPDLLIPEKTYSPEEDVVKLIPYWEGDLLGLRNFDYKKTLERINEFEHKLLLSRKDKQAQADSYYVLSSYLGYSKDKKWGHEKIDRESVEYLNIVSYINVLDSVFKDLSKDLQLPILYYEDVFLSGKGVEGFKVDMKYLDPSKKLRQSKTKVL